MYHKAYGIIETLAPLHVGASAGEETGNLNLIFRDQFTQTGIIPGSSIRGRFRADMRLKRMAWLEAELLSRGATLPPKPQTEEGKTSTQLQWLDRKAKELNIQAPQNIDENHWYGHESVQGQEDGGTTEALIKFEYASLVWLPVFCPGQPVVWVSCPWLLKRYKTLSGGQESVPLPYTATKGLIGRKTTSQKPVLFFNLGFLEIENEVDAGDLEAWIPPGSDLNPNELVIVDNNDMGMVHDMALYRQSRVKLLDDMKKVDSGAFFNVEALPEGSILAFPTACKNTEWEPLQNRDFQDLYFGGLESIGFGHCRVILKERA